jgi:hypothetical protein
MDGAEQVDADLAQRHRRGFAGILRVGPGRDAGVGDHQVDRMRRIEGIEPGLESSAVGNVDRGKPDARPGRAARRRGGGQPRPVAADQPELGLRSGIGECEAGTQPARRAGDHDNPVWRLPRHAGQSRRVHEGVIAAAAG